MSTTHQWDNLSPRQRQFHQDTKSHLYHLFKTEEDRGVTDVPAQVKKTNCTDVILLAYLNTISDDQIKNIYNCLYYLFRDERNYYASWLLGIFTNGANQRTFKILDHDVLDDNSILGTLLSNGLWNELDVPKGQNMLLKSLPATITKNHLLSLLQCLANIIWRINDCIVRNQVSYNFKDFEPMYTSAVKLYLEIKERAREYLKDFEKVPINGSPVSVEKFEELLLSSPGTDRSPFQL